MNLLTPQIGAEMQRRAALHLPQTRLDVNYYRIRRRLSFPLPLKELPVVPVEFDWVPEYPWAVWAMWEVEDRLLSLGCPMV